MQLIVAKCVTDAVVPYVDAHEDAPAEVLRKCLREMRAAGLKPMTDDGWTWEEPANLPTDWSRVYFQPVAA